MLLKYRIQNYSYLSKINEVKQRLSMQREPFYYFTVLRNYPFLRSLMTFLSFRILASSFSRLMEYAARKSNATSKLLTLCPGYKLFSPNFKSAYLSLLNIVLAGIVPGMQIIPLIMNHSLFTLSNSLI